MGFRLISSVKDCVPHSSRLIGKKFHNHGPDLSFINHYAPHSGRPYEEKTLHWENLQRILSEHPHTNPTYTLGDANARLHGCSTDVERLCTGHHVFGRGAQHVQNLSEEQLDNRQFLIDFCLFSFNDYMIMNTMFPKPDYQKCTFKEVLTEGFKAPWSPNRFAQIDFVLAPRAFKNSILDVTSRTDIAFNSDHSLISAKLRLRLRAGSIAPRQAAKKYHSPSDSQKQNYNDRIRAYFTLENDTPERLVNATNFILAMKKAAENTLHQKTKRKTNPTLVK